MANNSSAKKRIRQNSVRRLRNRFRLSSTRSAIKRLRDLTDRAEAEKMLPAVMSLLDKCVTKNIYHKNKASNLKSGLAKHIATLK